MTRLAVPAVLGVMLGCACSGPATPPDREFSLTGQVLALRPDALEITIRHDDIPGFMDAMTMPFKVKDRRLLAGTAPGDLVRATLIVTDEESYLSTLEKTGAAPLPPPVPEPPVTAADLFEVGEPVPQVTFVADGGGPLAISSLRGSAVVLTFIYTRCPLPEFCPLMDKRFAALQKAVLDNEALEGRVKLLTISFDPDRDTPDVLKAHAASLGADAATWRFVTADRETVDHFAAGFGLVVMRDDGTPGNITHNLRSAVLDPEGRLVKIYTGSDWAPEQILEDLQAVLTGGRTGR
ncbi:MAG: SCO family protein [Vicinamibacterales bacterium]